MTVLRLARGSHPNGLPDTNSAVATLFYECRVIRWCANQTMPDPTNAKIDAVIHVDRHLELHTAWCRMTGVCIVVVVVVAASVYGFTILM